MNAYRIQNCIVAARDEQEAIATWAKESGQPAASAGPVEQLPLTDTIMMEQEDGSYQEGPLSDAMPSTEEGPAIIAQGDCEECQEGWTP